eukprot:m.203874 g.203874  ORF g.203874 m.203874 type:complete len:191 (+) comp39633_c0_seq3:71-643(+)
MDFGDAMDPNLFSERLQDQERRAMEERAQQPSCSCRTRKRRGFREETESPSTKQFITEDKVAADLGGLFIDRNVHRLFGPSGSRAKDRDTTRVMIEDCSDGSDSDYSSDDICPSLPVIELDSKLKDHISMAPYTEVLPKKVLTSINPPCMELVVWRPRVDVILQLNREEESGYAKSNLETSSGDDIMDVE